MYSSCIHSDRRAVTTPDSLVDEKGRAVFGTFDSEFKRFDLLRVERPMNMPNVFNRLGLTQWEATEVHVRDGLLLAAVCDMGLFSKMLHVFYDKRSQLVYTWDHTMRSCRISDSLLNGEVSEGKYGESFIRYQNALERDLINLSGKVEGTATVSIPSDTAIKGEKNVEKKRVTLEYELSMKRVSRPSCVSMPFHDGKTEQIEQKNENPLGNRPVYSQKDLLSVSGRILLDGESLDIISSFEGSKTAQENNERPLKDLNQWTALSTNSSASVLSPSSTVRKEDTETDGDAHSLSGGPNCVPMSMITDAVAVVDDHRGYYPRHTHYDWLSSMGYITGPDGTAIRFGFNLTRNDALQEERYNENLLWFDGRTSLLPPVTFTQEHGTTRDFSKSRTPCVWLVEDAHGMVRLRFHLTNVSPILKHAVVVNIDYYIVFGKLEGFLRDENGQMYVLDGWTAIGEDKTLRFF